jgi:signal transduction histidine kinase
VGTPSRRISYQSSPPRGHPVLGERERRKPEEMVDAVDLSHELRSLLGAIRLATADLDRRLSRSRKTGQVQRDIAIIDTAERKATELVTWVLSSGTEDSSALTALRREEGA